MHVCVFGVCMCLCMFVRAECTFVNLEILGGWVNLKGGLRNLNEEQ